MAPGDIGAVRMTMHSRLLDWIRRVSLALLAYSCVVSAAIAQDQEQAPAAGGADPSDALKLYYTDPFWMLGFLWRKGFLPERLEVLLSAAIFGLIIGLLFSPWARPFLRRFGKILFAAFAALVVLFAIFGPPPTADYVADGLAIIAFIFTAITASRFGTKPAPPRPRPTSFGSAKWAEFADLMRNGLIGAEGFRLGHWGGQPLQYTGQRHLLTVAPTRSGKGVSSIIPNLLTYQGSALIVDPKGENALITAVRRGQGSTARNIVGIGQRVFLLDPWDIAASKLDLKSARFNPLDWIKEGDPDATENAFLLAEAIVPSESEGEARFWDEEAKALLTGIILYVALEPAEAKNRTLARVRDILVLDDDALKVALGKMFNFKHPVVSSTATRTASKDPKLRSSVLASAQSHTHFLESPRIRDSLSTTDFSFEDLKTSAMSVYLILPADRLKTFDRWLRLLIQQAITVNARNIELKPKRPILFLLDEMATLGRLPSVEQAFGLMAGFGMQLWGIVQDLSQLARIYGDNGWQTFISNSGVLQYFGSRDQMTAEYFSSLCGVTTVESVNVSSAIGQVFGSHSSSGVNSSSSGNSNSRSQTETVGRNEVQRKLAYPDELMVMKGHQQIVIIENFDPIAAQKIAWFDDPVLRLHGIDLQKNPFDKAAAGGPPNASAGPSDSGPHKT
jgi:type IV secretion system protein VirD4